MSGIVVRRNTPNRQVSSGVRFGSCFPVTRCLRACPVSAAKRLRRSPRSGAEAKTDVLRPWRSRQGVATSGPCRRHILRIG